MTAIKRQNPSSFNALKSLLQADFTVQLRQGRSIAVGVLLPLLYLFALRRAIPALGGTAVLAQCLSIGVPAIGLMGYAVVLSRDRDHGVFQRLRATPSTTTILMSSRILVQLAIIVVMTLVTIIAAAFIDDIQVGASKIPEAVVANLLVGLMFLSIGQTVVALLTSSESVNAVARFVYIGFLVMGTFLVPSRPGVDPSRMQRIAEWAPMGVARSMLMAALSPSTVNQHGLLMVLAAAGYTVFFAFIGIRWFKWVVS